MNNFQKVLIGKLKTNHDNHQNEINNLFYKKISNEKL